MAGIASETVTEDGGLRAGASTPKVTNTVWDSAGPWAAFYVNNNILKYIL